MFLYKLITSFFYFLFYPIAYLIFPKQNFVNRVSFRDYKINEECIWIHAASVGEVNAVKFLLKRLLEHYTNETFVVTCTTTTGLAVAKEISGKLIVQQFPLDISHIMKRFFRVFQPKLIILVETELWPIMLNTAFKKKVPVLMVNARMSNRSFRRYNFFKWFLKREFRNIQLVCAQSDFDEANYSRLKFNNVINGNNLKFAIDLKNHETHTLRHAWNIKFNDFVVAFGCSRPGEDEMIKKVYEQLKDQIPGLKIMIAPRHLQRLDAVKAIFQDTEYSMFTSLKEEKALIIIDEFGVLTQIYALSDVAIIGGSFFKKYKGHNPLEAIWYEKAVIIGPYHSSCKSTVDKLLSDGGIIISDEVNLANDILKLYQNKQILNDIGKKAKKVLTENQHAIDIHWEALTKWI
jgi:3-deoxy-D-manno-octulosonic-acid transferase